MPPSAPFRDLRHAVRRLAAIPGFTALAVASLAIGIGAPTTIFTVANATLLRPLPVAAPDRLVEAYANDSGGSGFHSFSYPDFLDLRQQTRALTGLAAYDALPCSVAATGEPALAVGGLVSGNYFQVLDAQPELGRFFAADEDGPATARNAVVLSDAYWRAQFSADPGAIGRTIRVNGVPYTVVGVTRPELSRMSALLKPDLWVTMGTAPLVAPDKQIQRRTYASFQLVGRLAPGVERAAAARELTGIMRRIGADHPEVGSGHGVDLYPAGSVPAEMRGPLAAFMAVLMAFGGLILLVACGNVASMLLARGVGLRRELAIRTALGASRARLVVQLTLETVLLFVGGAAAALGLAFAATRAFANFHPPVGIPITLDIPLDWRVFVFALAAAVVVGATFGLLPAFRSTRTDVATVLKNEATNIAGKSRGRAAIVIGQMAFTVMLLIGAGLVVRALSGALSLDPGFARDHLTVATTDLRMARLTPDQAHALQRAWRDAVAAVPGVQDVALTTRPPLGTGNSTAAIAPPGSDGARGHLESADWSAVSPEYFRAMHIPLLAGRAFSSTDHDTANPVAIISNALAKRYYGDAGHAVGQWLRTGSKPADRELIVGVAADVKVRSLVEPPRDMLYEPVAQVGVRDAALLVRSSRPDIARVIDAALRRLDSSLPLMSVLSYEQYMGVALLPQRMMALFASILGLAGLVLATLGVYGIVAYSVTQRTREIGIRIALGALPSRVVGTMARAGVQLIAAGAALGVLLALAVTRLLGALLLGVSPTDFGTFAVVVLGLGAIGLLACAIPASRAARVDPATALRTD